jgi:hypothetical protein
MKERCDNERVGVSVKVVLFETGRSALPWLDALMCLRCDRPAELTEVTRLYFFDRGWDAALRELQGLPALLCRHEGIEEASVHLSAPGRGEVTFAHAR